MSWVKISGVKMSVGSNCLLRGWGQSVWGQSVLGSKCLWGQNVFFWLGVKVSLGPKCLWGQNVLRVKVSWGQSVFGVKMSVGSKCLWGQNGCEPYSYLVAGKNYCQWEGQFGH